MDNNLILNILERVLGTSYKLPRNEMAFFCPKCNHRKRKLQVNLISGRSHCWICNLSAHNIPQLLRKINASVELINEAYQILGTSKSRNYDNVEKTKQAIVLPKEFKPLWKKTNDTLYKHAITYLQQRNIIIGDILRYGMGYCVDGIYANRIIIPSYDYVGSLNYFIARDMFPNSKMKYKNPPFSKNIIMFELLIAWNNPLILTEGVFDAIAIRKNAIPLLGKFMSNTLKKRIIKEKVSQIYIALDSDAASNAVDLAQDINNLGIEAKIIDLDKDPSEQGFKKFWTISNQALPTTFSDIINRRLYGR